MVGLTAFHRGLFPASLSSGCQQVAILCGKYPMSPGLTLRMAAATDAEFMAPLNNQAGRGTPQSIWACLAVDNQSALDKGLARTRGMTSRICWRNAWIAEVLGIHAGVLNTILNGAKMPGPDADTPAVSCPCQNWRHRRQTVATFSFLQPRQSIRDAGSAARCWPLLTRWKVPVG